MVVRSQDETAIYDLSKLLSVFADEKGCVYGLNYSGELAYTLGEYRSQDRAVEVVDEIYAMFDGQSRYDMPLI